MSRRFRCATAALLAIVALGSCTSTKHPAGTLVVMETTLGTIEIQADEAAAPVSSSSFLAFVDAGYYDGAAFYRTVSPENDNGSPPISVIQGGVIDSTKTLPPVPHESTVQTGLKHLDGVVSLARGEPGTGSGAAFFICIGDQPALDYGAMRNKDGLGFAAFGNVVKGMDVVHAIHARPADGPTESPYMQGQMLSDHVEIRRAYRR